MAGVCLCAIPLIVIHFFAACSGLLSAGVQLDVRKLRTFNPLHESPGGRGIEDIESFAKAMMGRAFKRGILQANQFNGTGSTRKKFGISTASIAQMK